MQVETFEIIHPEHGVALCDEAAWPGFSAHGWERKGEVVKPDASALTPDPSKVQEKGNKKPGIVNRLLRRGESDPQEQLPDDLPDSTTEETPPVEGTPVATDGQPAPEGAV